MEQTQRLKKVTEKLTNECWYYDYRNDNIMCYKIF
jgi:hypothetical protein